MHRGKMTAMDTMPNDKSWEAASSMNIRTYFGDDIRYDL